MQPAGLVERAPAKVNLSLHVIGRRADGYHLLDSLVGFAAIGDELRLAPGPSLSLVTLGREAQGAGPNADNLVLRAARALTERVEGLRGGGFRLIKRLPAAAGLGGGSSDAAAALRLLARLNRLDLDDPRLRAAAAATGSDVPVCLDPRPRRMSGTGEMLSAPLPLPRIPALLVNPRQPAPTGAVFAGLGLAPGASTGAAPIGTACTTRAELLSTLERDGNDLEAPALAVAPAVAEALALLRAERGCRLARMSGSGSTVFGLFDSCRASAAAAATIRAAHPAWWVKPTMIG